MAAPQATYTVNLEVQVDGPDGDHWDMVAARLVNRLSGFSWRKGGAYVVHSVEIDTAGEPEDESY